MDNGAGPATEERPRWVALGPPFSSIFFLKETSRDTLAQVLNGRETIENTATHKKVKYLPDWNVHVKEFRFTKNLKPGDTLKIHGVDYNLEPFREDVEYISIFANQR